MTLFLIVLWVASGCSSDPPHEATEAAAVVYTCPMHPSVRMPAPGQCPICGMDLVPATDAANGGVVVSDDQRATYGIRTEAVRREPMSVEVRAVGTVAYDERRLTDVVARVQGWVAAVDVSQVGDRVEKGAPLLSITSPELVAAQRELLITSKGTATGLQPEARDRLRLLGMHDTQIDAVLSSGQPKDPVVLRAPAAGVVVEKGVVTGDEVTPGMRLFRIGDPSAVWIEAAVYASDLAAVRVDMPAAVEIEGREGALAGTVRVVRPAIDPQTRTVGVRVELEDPPVLLLPGLLATVTLSADRGERLTVPENAVLYAGERRVVFVDAGEGRLEPKDVTVGLRSRGRVEIVSGLAENEVVVSSGVFLVASESRLRAPEGGDAR
jgi:membrane fusion protein, copper/silver efflux system